MGSPFSAFSSPLGPLHLAPASSSSSFIADLTRLSFFTRSSKSKSSNKPKYSHPHQSSTDAARGLSVREDKSAAAPTYYPRDYSIPPTYEEAVGIEEDLQAEEGSSAIEGSSSKGPDAKKQRKQQERERLLRQDREMGAGLSSMGL